jgi:hypothetical protein
MQQKKWKVVPLVGAAFFVDGWVFETGTLHWTISPSETVPTK